MKALRRPFPVLLLVLFAAGVLSLSSCGSGGSSTTGPPGGGGGVNNVAPAVVNLGPAGNASDLLYTSVTICVPGTANCQTIDGVLVDTGSSGLRLLASVVTIPLPLENDQGGNRLSNCAQFADGSVAFGAVALADIQLPAGGEMASSIPIQSIANANVPSQLGACFQTMGGVLIVNASELGANGILGVGQFRQDCGPACATGNHPPPVYFSCPNGGCTETTVPLANQIQNPVWKFPQDNNGVLISLPSVPATGAATVSGSLIFGVGTQDNNALGSAKVYTTDSSGFFTASYNNVAYPQSFVDSGSNGFFFLDAATSGLATCPGDASFYCPPATANFTVTTTGQNQASGMVSFSIGNAQTLFTGNPTFSAFSNVGGPFPTAFDFGLSFFYGRSVFTAIEGQSTPGGTGPFVAY